MRLHSIETLFTDDVTISGDRQVDTTDDGLGGTQPVFETFDVSTRGRFEPNGEELRRRFLGEDATNDPALALRGDDVVGEYGDFYGDTYGGGYVVVEPGDTVTFDDRDGTFEVRSIDEFSLSGGVPELVILELERVD